MDLLDSGQGVTGYVDELKLGRPMEVTAPGGVQVKVTAGPDGVKVIVLAHREDDARRLLRELGFGPGKTRSMLCG